MNGVVIRDVIAIIAQGRGEERHEPYGADPEFLQVVELLLEPGEITNAIPVAVVESSNVHLIDDRVLVTKGVSIQWQPRSPGRTPDCFSSEHANTPVYMKWQHSNFAVRFPKEATDLDSLRT